MLVRQGGLYRCCIDRAKKVKEAKEGDIIKCTWCYSKMVFKDGAFEWAKLVDAKQKIKETKT